MSIRFQKLIFLRIAILALLAGFSSFSYSDFVWRDSVSGYTAATRLAVCQHMPGNTVPSNWVLSGVITILASDQYGPTDAECVFSSPAGAARTIYRQGSAPVCSGGQSYNSTTQQCQCPPGNEFTGGVCVPIPCPSGQVRDGVSGECVWITSCPSGQSLFKTTVAGGATASASCVPNSGNQFACNTYSQMQSEYCKGEAESCTATGGTFGVVSGSNVCIPAGNGIPPCQSGGSQFVTNEDGSSSPTCVGTSNIGDPGALPSGVEGGKTPATSAQESGAATANNTAEIARINNAGFQAVVNAINNNTGKTAAGGGGGGSSAAQDSQNAAGIVQAINEFKNQEKGAGQCDPKKDDYAKCIGQNEDAPDTDGSTTRANAITQGNASIDAAADTVVEGINASSAMATPDTNDFVGSVLNYLPQPASCNNYSTSIKGVSFSVKCDDTSIFREWGKWVLALLTIYGIFLIMFRRVS